MTEWCCTCGIREYLLGDDPVKQLLDIYVREKSEFKHIVALAQFSQGYDLQFILKRIAENSSARVLQSVILN